MDKHQIRTTKYAFPEFDQEIEELEAQLEPDVVAETGFKRAVIIDNLPQVGPEKLDKLVGIIRKICSTIGPYKESSFVMPVDPKTNNSLGFAFVEYDNAEDAQKAFEQLNGYKLDKAHIFRVNRYDDFQRYDKVPEQYVPPEPRPAPPQIPLRQWLLDTKFLQGAEQFAIRYADETEIHWSSETADKPAPVYERKDWTESYVRWSPYGNYVATFHAQGVILWGGPEFKRLHRFHHPGVKLIDFSPRENYMVTISSQFQSNDNPKDPQCIVVWELSTGRRLRGFPSLGSTQWPAFYWSHDDKYFARLGTDMISVYEAPSCDMVDNKSIKIPGVKDFQWSPTSNMLVYWVPEQSNIPAKVVLLDFPSRNIKRQQNLLNVADCKIHWQSKGDYLCVRVDRMSKAKKTPQYNYFEFFRIREKDIPVEHLEIKEAVTAFEWEPNGNRFAVLVNEGPRPDVQFHQLKGKSLTHLKTLEKKAVNQLVWSPKGNFIVLAGLKNPHNGQLEFFNVNELETMAAEEHFMCTDVEWDPSGRFVATWVSAWKLQLENGYNLWTFQGKLLRKQLKEKFYSFSWRPRPPQLLSAAQEESLQANLEKLMEQMEKEDKERIRSANEKWQKEREEVRLAWEQYEKQKLEEWAALREQRKKLFSHYPPERDEDFTITEETIEELIDVRQEVVA